MDDEAGIAETLDFIQREDLGDYDVFTLQVLPGTAVRQQAREYGLVFQERPPYYVLATDHLSYADLHRLRRDLKEGANIASEAIEGMPEPRRDAMRRRDDKATRRDKAACLASPCIDQLWLLPPDPVQVDELVIRQLAAHVDAVLRSEDLVVYTPVLATAISANPSTIFDVYLVCEEEPPSVDTLLHWRETLPFQPGYLDRVAVYQASDPEEGYMRVSPRCFLLLPWTSPVEPHDFRDVAAIIWRFGLAEGDTVPFNAWRAAGGAGVWLHFAPDCTTAYRSQVSEVVVQWEEETGRRVWFAL